ncbi:MAG TPA: hypothetical protein VIJ82_25580 [Streptosporangiaceae bacterium]
MLDHEQGRFGDGESKVTFPDLGQLVGKPVTMQRQQRIHPRGDHHAQAGPDVPQYEVKPMQHIRVS